MAVAPDGQAIPLRSYYAWHSIMIETHRSMMPLKQGKILAPSQCRRKSQMYFCGLPDSQAVRL